ncbi:hypothetical protein LguiB_006231 [Lonicera macranthoides]
MAHYQETEPSLEVHLQAKGLNTYVFDGKREIRGDPAYVHATYANKSCIWRVHYQNPTSVFHGDSDLITLWEDGLVEINRKPKQVIDYHRYQLTSIVNSLFKSKNNRILLCF